MYKKLACLLCLVFVLCMLMTACGGGSETSDSEQPGGESSAVSDDSSADDSESDDPYIDDSGDDSSTDESGDNPLNPSGNTTGNSGKKTTTNGNVKTTAKKSGGKYDPYAGITADMKGKTVKILIVNGAGDDDTASGDAFKKKTGIRYRFQGVQLPMYKTKLTADVASGSPPDLAVMTVAGTGDYPAMILNGTVQPLPSGVFDLEQDTELDTFQMEWTSWGGKIYGIQLKNSTEYQRGVIVYNKTMFQERGVTTPYELWKKGKWDRAALATAMEKMTFMQGTEKIYGFVASDGITSMLSAGQTDFVKKGKNDTFVNNLSDSKLISLLQWASNLREKGYWMADSNGAASAFRSGKAAMWADQSWIMANLTGAYDQLGKNTCEVVPFPSDKGGDDAVQPIDASVWCIPTGAANPKEACYFARWWLDASNVDLNAYYPNKQFVEMHNAMSYAKKKFSQVSAGICGYDDVAKHSNLLFAFQEPANDIPVSLQEQKPMLDGIIKRINGMKAP